MERVDNRTAASQQPDRNAKSFQRTVGKKQNVFQGSDAPIQTGRRDLKVKS